ncbi:hypothetical protein PoB_004060300, partial [Plakobranchus ocellatus]
MQESFDNQEDMKSKLRPITAAPPADANVTHSARTGIEMEEMCMKDMNRNKEVGGFFSSSSVSNNNISSNHNSNFFSCNEEPLDINVRNLENLSLMDNFSTMTSALSGLENNENLLYFQDFDSMLNPYIDDPKEGNISKTVRVPSSEHVAEIVGRQ